MCQCIAGYYNEYLSIEKKEKRNMHIRIVEKRFNIFYLLKYVAVYPHLRNDCDGSNTVPISPYILQHCNKYNNMENEEEITKKSSVNTGVGIHEVIDLFSNMSPTKCAKFVSVAIDEEIKIAHTLTLSPDHNSLIQQNKTINLLTKNCPEKAQQLKELAAETYIKSKREKDEFSIIAKRAINFDSSQEVVTPTEEQTMNEGKQNEDIIPNRKRRRTNVQWNTITETMFQSELECQSYLRDKFPTLRVKENKKGKNKITRYQCYEDSTKSMKQRIRGTCYAMVVTVTSTTASATISPISVSLKTSMDVSVSADSPTTLKKCRVYQLH